MVAGRARTNDYFGDKLYSVRGRQVELTTGIESKHMHSASRSDVVQHFDVSLPPLMALDPGRGVSK
jgi:hypothetical protein